MMDFRDNMQKCQEYVQALEQERTKIQVFQRELPLCLDLVTQAIEACKQQLCGGATTECFNGHSECSEETTSHDNGPVLEEFIPLKRSNNSSDEDEDVDDDEELDQSNEENNNNNSNNSDKSGKKSDWLRSVQLWNQTPDPPTTTTQEEIQPKRVAVVEVKKNGVSTSSGGAFHPFQKENSNSNIIVNKPTPVPAASACSSAQEAAGAGGGSGSGSGGKKEEKGGQSSSRKARRCWSPELHKRFLHALQQLGGSHVATPKQIREMMKVDGLTNDEVKSHLQKYRLHTRRPSQNAHNNTNSQAPQFVVVGGIWMPTDYATVAATTTSGDTNAVSAPNGGIYAPVAKMAAPSPRPQSSKIATHRQQQQQNQSSQSHCEERGSHSDGVHSNSPTTSSSTHTTTASHAY